MEVEGELNAIFSPLNVKQRQEVFRRLLDNTNFYAIWGELERNTGDEFITGFIRSNDVEKLITQLPVSEEDAKIIYDELIKEIKYVTGPHTPLVRSRVGTPVGSNNEYENESNGSMSSRKRKSRKAKSRKARKSRKSRKSLRRHLD